MNTDRETVEVFRWIISGLLGCLIALIAIIHKSDIAKMDKIDRRLSAFIGVMLEVSVMTNPEHAVSIAELFRQVLRSNGQVSKD